VIEKIFRSYDIRGAYPNEVNENIAYIVGHYFGDLCKGQKIIIGFDGRLSSGALFEALIQAITEAGAIPVSLGLVPTPVLYFANSIFSPAAAIMITASHNPKEDNGFKMILSGESFFGEKISGLKKFAANFHRAYHPFKYLDIENIDISEDYIKRILQDIKINSKLKIAWDIGNGAAGDVVSKLVQSMPNNNIVINAEIDGNFPVHSPDPMEESNLDMLLETIKENQCDLGIAFDGDADRVVFITSQGDILYGDQTVLLFAEDVLRSNSGATIIVEVKSSQVLLGHIEKCGGKVLMCKTGHSIIKTTMKKTGALLAGELSGHMFFADKYFGYDDAIYAALRMIDLLSRNETSLDILYSQIPKLFTTPEIKISIPDDKKFQIIEDIKQHLRGMGREFIDIDGIRYSDGDSWWLVRASNTEPSITLRLEAALKENLYIIKSDLKDILSAHGINVDF